MNRFSLFKEVKKLQKEKAEIANNYKRLNELGNLVTDDEIEFMQETTAIDEKIQILNAAYLIEKAENLFIPIPERKSPSWERSISIMNHWQLSPKGITDLKEAIRRERSYILIWIAAVTGLLGAATGLIAIIKSS